MSDADLTIKLKTMFGRGGLYEGARDATSTLRGSLSDRPSVGELPVLKLGEADDRQADLSMGPTLGEGGVGVVSLARQNALKRDVAVKRFRSKDRDDGELLHEALMMGIVEHPNVVPVHLVGRDAADGSPVIVMKRVEGVTWSQVLADPTAAPQTDAADLDYHLRVLLQLCHAVRYAHSSGVLHLDIKPGNVMLGSFGEVYLADWGIATLIGPGGVPNSGSLRGTPSYMAPEMANPEEGRVDIRTDVFLLGATLHRVITGQRLHKAETPMDTVRVANAFGGLEISDEIDAELADITRKAVDPDPDARYQSIEEFQNAVQRYLDHRESISLARLSAELVDQVEQAIETEGRPDAEQLAEARFALRRALDIWPDSPDAIDLRRRLASAIFDWALENDDINEAERAAAALPTAERATFGRSLEEARARLRHEREELEELRQRRDRLTGKRTRILVGGSAAALWAGIAGLKGWMRWGVPLGEVDPNYLVSLIPTFGLPVALLIIFRKMLMATEFNRRVMVFFCGGIATVASIRLTGWAYDLPAYVTTGMEFVSYSLLGVLLGALTDLRISAASLLLVVATVLAIVFPGYQYVFMFVAFSFVGPYVCYVWVSHGKG